MSWIKRYKGKHVTIDPKNPEGLGICDYSGFVFNHKDLHKQMDWRGNSYVWTGFMVGKPYLDKPQEQNRPAPIKDDPRPLKNPRLPEFYGNPPQPVLLPYKQLLLKLQQFNWNN